MTIDNISIFWKFHGLFPSKNKKSWLYKLPKSSEVEKADVRFNKNLNLFINKMAKLKMHGQEYLTQ